MGRRLGRLLLGLVFVAAMAMVSQAKADGLPKNSIHLEGLGAGILYSINYERVLPHNIGVRLGFGFVSMGASANDASPSPEPGDPNDSSNPSVASVSVTLISVPISVTYLGIKSKSNHHILELGLGTTVLIAGGKITFLGATVFAGAGATGWLHAIVGYRLQAGAFQFRAGFSPLIDFEDGGVIPLPHLSLGASF
jgi:hypothetical protein